MQAVSGQLQQPAPKWKGLELPTSDDPAELRQKEAEFAPTALRNYELDTKPPKDGKDILSRFEGAKRDKVGNYLPYVDSNGFVTTGIGRVVKDKEGRPVPETAIPDWRTRKDLIRDAKTAETEYEKEHANTRTAVQKALTRPVTPLQLDMLTSLAYNRGPDEALEVVRKINAGDMEGAADQFLVFNNVKKGDPTKLLFPRRVVERYFFKKGR